MSFKLMVLSSCVNREMNEKTTVISSIFSALQSKLDDLRESETWDAYGLDDN